MGESMITLEELAHPSNKGKMVYHKKENKIFLIAKRVTLNGEESIILQHPDYDVKKYELEDIEWFDTKNCPQEFKPYLAFLNLKLGKIEDRVDRLYEGLRDISE